jgi:hypothetical protein
MCFYLFLDDERELKNPKYSEYLLNHPDGAKKRYTERPWKVVRNIDEFKAMITKKGIPAVMSLDHDLAEGEGRDGIDCLKWLKSYCHKHKKRFVSLVFYHSANPIGIKNMKEAIKDLTIETIGYS